MTDFFTNLVGQVLLPLMEVYPASTARYGPEPNVPAAGMASEPPALGSTLQRTPDGRVEAGSIPQIVQPVLDQTVEGIDTQRISSQNLAPWKHDPAAEAGSAHISPSTNPLERTAAPVMPASEPNGEVERALPGGDERDPQRLVRRTGTLPEPAPGNPLQSGSPSGPVPWKTDQRTSTRGTHTPQQPIQQVVSGRRQEEKDTGQPGQNSFGQQIENAGPSSVQMASLPYALTPPLARKTGKMIEPTLTEMASAWDGDQDQNTVLGSGKTPSALQTGEIAEQPAAAQVTDVVSPKPGTGGSVRKRSEPGPLPSSPQIQTDIRLPKANPPKLTEERPAAAAGSPLSVAPALSARNDVKLASLAQKGLQPSPAPGQSPGSGAGIGPAWGEKTYASQFAKSPAEFEAGHHPEILPVVHLLSLSEANKSLSARLPFMPAGPVFPKSILLTQEMHDLPEAAIQTAEAISSREPGAALPVPVQGKPSQHELDPLPLQSRSGLQTDSSLSKAGSQSLPPQRPVPALPRKEGHPLVEAQQSLKMTKLDERATGMHELDPGSIIRPVIAAGSMLRERTPVSDVNASKSTVPTVHLTIGRIVVKGIPPAALPPFSPVSARRQAPVSLSDYLARHRRNG